MGLNLYDSITFFQFGWDKMSNVKYDNRITYYCPFCDEQFAYLYEIDSWGMLINHLRARHQNALQKQDSVSRN